MSRVLITGAAGFIGSHLCDAYVARGDEVIGLDNFYTGNRKNLKTLEANPKFKLIKHDVRKPFPEVGRIDLVQHLACPASPVAYQRDPQFTLETNLAGTQNALECAVQHRARFVQASTSEVYGSPSVHPQSESYWGNVNPLGPRSCYDEGKRGAETFVMIYHEQHVLDGRIVRIFNTYGPRMAPDDGRVVSNFIMQALSGRPLTIYGDGEQTRSFCFVSDLVRGLMLAGDKEDLDYSPVNLGNPEEMTVVALAKMVIEQSGSESKIISAPLPEDDPPRRRPEIARAQKLLNWQPQISLKQGLKETIDFFKGVALG